MNSNEKLSPHFTLGELTASDTAARRAIDNTPSEAIVSNLHRVAATLEAVRALHGKPLVVTSGYRCPALNQAVGGARDSAHVKGLAADINVPGISPYDLGSAIINAGIEFDQLIHEFGSWVHIGLAPDGVKPRGQLLTIKRGTGYVSGWNP